jgi:hypothetical protein
MPKRPFKIVPDEEVGKTEILYKGEEHHLKELKEHFSSIESSEIYPSFDEDFRFTMFFRNTQDAFLSKLFRYCKNNLPRLEGREEGIDLWFYIKWTAIVLGSAFVLYVGYYFINWVMLAKERIDPDSKTKIEREVSPG